MKKFPSLLLSILLIGCGGGGGGGGGSSTGSGAQPLVALSAATGITVNGAILNGSVIPNGMPTECWFEYGTDPGFATYDNNAKHSVGSGITSQPVRHTAVGLNAGTTYYYRICAANSIGTTRSSIASFVTSSPGSPPALSTLTATSVSASGATLNGNVTPNGLATNVWFDWGTDPTLVSHNTTATQLAGSGTTSQVMTATLTGLSSGVTYYYRVCANNSAGTSWGTVVGFIPGSAPTVTTLATTTVSGSGATLNGYVTPNGLATDAWFEWGTDPSLAVCNTTSVQAVGSGTTNQLVSVPITGLAAGTRYYYRAVAANSSGTSRGTIGTVTPGQPSVTTLAATSITAAGATLNGNVTPNGLATNVWFDWGTDPTLVSHNTTATQFAGSGTTSQVMTAMLTGLSPGVTCYYRVCANNSVGTSWGTINSFAPGSGPPGPVYPIPTGLWEPAPGSTPSSGNYVYLKSDPGDYIGAGQTYTYTPANAQISIGASGGHLSTRVAGNQNWWGDFQTMNTLSQLQPGLYDNLLRYPFHNPASGGLVWGGEGRGCNTLTGWFIVDNVTYVSGVLAAIDLRFEQHCEGGSPALHGRIHWSQ